ncbi:MAG: sugar ABC transporter permease [Thermoflexales bacterium]|nr:sugar ABC transporter permease [Thermoflexales bacterium]
MNPKLYTLLWAIATVAFIILSSLAVASVAKLVARWRGKNRLYQSRTFAGYFFASPWIVGYIIFVIGPTLASLYWSFTRFKLPAPPVWVGLQNYIQLLTTDDQFRVSILNSLYVTLFGLPLQLATALVLALLLYRRLPGEQVFRMIYYLPVMLAANSAMLITWRLVLNPNNGILNTLIRMIEGVFPFLVPVRQGVVWFTEITNAAFLGLQRGDFNLLHQTLARGLPGPEVMPLWHQSQLWSKPAIILIGVWSCGTMMMIYLAALSSVPPHLYEAALVDGANGWQRFWRITFPMISPATFYNLVVGIIATLQIFEQSYVLTDNGGPAQSTYFVAYYLWRSTFRFNKIGYGAAMSWILLVLILILTLIQFRLANKWVYYEYEEA